LNLSKTRFSSSFWVLCGVVAILAVLAVLQYRWIDQVSQAEQQQLKEDLRLAMNRFARDFDGEVFHSGLMPPPPEPYKAILSERDFNAAAAARLAPQHDELMSSRNAGLVQDLFLARILAPGKAQLLRFDPHAQKLEQTEWPREFWRFRDFCLAESNLDPTEEPFRSKLIPDLGDVPAVIFPFILPVDRHPKTGGPTDWEIIRIDRKSFQQLLSRLVVQNFSRNGAFDYDILIVQKHSNQVIYSSRDVDPGNLERTADASITLNVPGGVPFSTSGGMVFSIGLSSVVVPGGPIPTPPDPPAFPKPRIPQGGQLVAQAGPLFRDSLMGWQLYARHHSGSLESFVSQFRTRNLAISSAAFLLLALGLAFTFISSQRIRAMGKLQLEFAAGLSHELRTPLTVLRSAGYNLVHGNIAGGDEIVKYGTMIQREGARLSEMVEQALLFAQTQSGRSQYRRAPVEVSSIIEDVIVSCREMQRQCSCEIVSDVQPDLPLALTDEKAISHCLRNLLINALKYGETSGRIEISANCISQPGVARIKISVVNGGRAIDPDDLGHIFQPFFRGRNATGIAGSGLGLYMVESIAKSLGGRIEVTSSAKETRLDLYVPAAELDLQET